MTTAAQTLSDRPPEGAAPYKRTAVFDETTIPEGLRADHSTKPGVWALIHVLEGRLLYHLLDARQTFEIDAGERLASPPERPHKVEPVGAMRMYIEFWR